MILKFTGKILQKEKGKLFLPFISILLTTIVVTLSYFVIYSAKDYLNNKNKEFLGGDISFRSSQAFEASKYLDKNLLEKNSKQISFSGILKFKDVATNVDFNFTDNLFPLYGKVKLQNSEYKLLAKNEIYIDTTLQKKLNIKVGEEIFFNEIKFIVKDIVLENPENLIAGFSFLPKVILNLEALEYAKVDLNLFRKDFTEKIILKNNSNLQTDKNLQEKLKTESRKDGIRVSFGGESGGIQFGLDIVEKFLIVVVLIIVVLAMVNIYASINFLVARLKKDFGILMAIGLNGGDIYKILFLVNTFIIFISSLLGIIISQFSYIYSVKYLKVNFAFELTKSFGFWEILGVFAFIYLISFFSTIPIYRNLNSLKPKDILYKNESQNKFNFTNSLKDILIVIMPITFFAIYFLNSFLYGTLVILGIIFIYSFIIFLYYLFINLIYKYRNIFSFPIKTIITQKKFDGFLGLITFASLFIALISVYTLSILRTSIETYLKGDLRANLPSVYILDLQKSQIKNFTNIYKNINLFPNVRARLVSIDNIDIQKELEKENGKFDKEFTREFNLTYRKSLLNSEEVISRDFENLKTGEVSLEEGFAKRLNAKVDSVLVVNIQGFDVKTKVTSIRKVDTRSGLPFFYLIYSPDELEKYPATFFGYMNLDEAEINNLYLNLSTNFPNLSIINTSSITKIAETIIATLVLIILIITLPPIILSTLLIITIISSLSKDRKRDGARLMAIGKTGKFVRNYFILETSSTTLFASVFAYILSVFMSNFIVIYFLKIKEIIFIDMISLYIFIFLFIGIILLGLILWYKDKKNIKEYLNYEENN